MDKETGNAFLIIIIILLVIAFIGLFIYTKVSPSSSPNTPQNLQSDSTTNQEESNSDNNLAQNTASSFSTNNVNTLDTNFTPPSSVNTNITVDLGCATTELPYSWKDKYEVEKSTVENHTIYSFISISDKEFGGHIFSIWIEDANSNEIEEIDLPSYNLVKSNANYKIFCVNPTDVQFDINNSANYSSMYDSKQFVLDNIKFK